MIFNYRLLKEDEAKRWVGLFANKHPHMGNRTSGRAESFHSGLKKALGNQSASRMPLAAVRMNAYYERKVFLNLKKKKLLNGLYVYISIL